MLVMNLGKIIQICDGHKHIILSQLTTNNKVSVHTGFGRARTILYGSSPT